MLSFSIAKQQCLTNQIPSNLEFECVNENGDSRRFFLGERILAS
jgi:hypothetical protein